MSLTVTIRVNSDGDFSYEYDPKSRRVKVGDEVDFRCAAPGLQHFAVHVGWDTPLEKGRYRSYRDGIVAKVRGNARPGVYEFFVAALVESTDGKTALYTDDPDFIVEN